MRVVQNTIGYILVATLIVATFVFPFNEVMATEVLLQVSASADDARARSSGASYNNNQTTYYVGIKGGLDFWIGHRWQSVAIPQGATIDSAVLDIYNATIGQGTSVEMIVYGNDVDSAAAYSSGNRPSDNTDTTAFFSTAVSVATFQTAQGFGNVTWDIKDVVQEIVDRAGWVTGNNMAIVMRDNGSAVDTNISMSTYDRAVDRGAKLTVNYSVGGGPSDEPVSPSIIMEGEAIIEGKMILF